MELITFKLQADILKKVDRLLKPLHFNNRTEFIREAIREKLKKIEEDEFEQKLRRFYGAAKTKTTPAEERRIRNEVANEYAHKFGIKLE